MSALRLRDRLHEIDVPTLVIGSDQDTTVDVGNILAEFQALSNGQRHLHIYHAIGHSPNVEVPCSVASIIQEFCQRS